MERQRSIRLGCPSGIGRVGLSILATLCLGLGVIGVAPGTAAAATPSLRKYSAVAPARICDTRAAQAAVVAANRCNHNGGAAGTLIGPSSMTVAVAGLNGVPMTATAVVLNVTATGTSATSFLTVWPSGSLQPTASNLNWVPHQTVPNLVEVAVGGNGAVDVFNNAGTADVIMDLEGYVDAGATALLTPVTPLRICDTRATGFGVPANPCNAAGAGTLTPAKHTFVAAIAPPGVITAAVLNVTVTNTTAASFLVAWPNGTAPPPASNLNWSAGQTVANRVIVPVGTDGNIEIFNAAGSTDVIIDVGGYFTVQPGGSGFVPIAPQRLCDTRAIQPPFIADNTCNHNGPSSVGPKNVLTLNVNAPPGIVVKALVLNVTVTNTTADSFLTAFPDNAMQPVASDLNWVRGETVPNLVVVQVGPDSGVKFFNDAGRTDLVVDIEGYYTITPTA